MQHVVLLLGLLRAPPLPPHVAPRSALGLLRAPQLRPLLARMQGGDGLGGMDGDLYGDTFFSTIDGRDEDGVSPEGVLPPGDDLIEKDLRRLFSVDPDVELEGGSLADADEVKLMWKLRKELGDADFNAIFNDRRIQGPDLK